LAVCGGRSPWLMLIEVKLSSRSREDTQRYAATQSIKAEDQGSRSILPCASYNFSVAHYRRASAGPWHTSDASSTSIDEKSAQDQRLILIPVEAFFPRRGFLRDRWPRQSGPTINSTPGSIGVDARGRHTSDASTRRSACPLAFDRDPRGSTEPISRPASPARTPPRSRGQVTPGKESRPRSPQTPFPAVQRLAELSQLAALAFGKAEPATAQEEAEKYLVGELVSLSSNLRCATGAAGRLTCSTTYALKKEVATKPWLQATSRGGRHRLTRPASPTLRWSFCQQLKSGSSPKISAVSERGRGPRGWVRSVRDRCAARSRSQTRSPPFPAGSKPAMPVRAQILAEGWM
jgi:hypothetical protein